jgi:hypothetical protein
MIIAPINISSFYKPRIYSGYPNIGHPETGNI